MMRAWLLLACLAFVCSCGREEGGTGAAAGQVALEPADSEGRLDPAPYRARIEAAEALLYAVDELSDEGWKALSQALLDLHNEIVFRDHSAAARRVSARLFFLSARADAMTSARHGDVELAELRELWRELSVEKFAPVDWSRGQATSR